MTDSKTRKHKVSKKTKKSWRKYVDIKDVDAFLEDKRLEERLGVFSEYSNSQLFIVDNTANTIESGTTSKHATRLALKTKELKCFASLKPHTLVPDPISVRNRVKTKEERVNFILRQCRAERKNVLKLKEKEALKNKVLAKTAAANCPEKGEIKSDIWDSTTDLLPKPITNWMSADGIRHTIKHLGVQKRKLPSSLLKKSSVLPAVENPHPGTSYNPSYSDHQKLLHEAAEKEVEFIKQQQHLDRVTTRMFKKIPVNKREEYLIKEMSEGLPTKNQFATNLNSTEDHNEENLSVATANNKPVKNTKKTLVQRRKQREQKQASNELSLIKLEKKKLSDIYKLRILQKQIEAKEKKQEILRQKRIKNEEKKSILPKTLSKTKFEPLDLDFRLAEELTGNLRNCKSSTNLLKDRYKSLQQRNMVAPAVIKLTRDKAKVKKFVKPDHKINMDDIKLK
nr:PREDICTED: uncharacterized protein CG1785 [Linepithema humile]XP_012228256.1 PREDICTED: uncharacterized protein CG1785 [Linepithema humile]XP_012228257.1 PREDICTED: uncharacterized protein CG1785 [Linepithema humile]